ncbi:MAG: TolC family protein, partial [Bacteroidota bacterium]|nr:TolC family protein [Bacteroidota bacterium]
RVLEAWGSAMPSLDLAGHYVHMIDKPVTFFPDYFLYSFLKTADPSTPSPTGKLIPISFAPSHSADASLTARQILFNGAVFVGVGAAQIYSDLTQDLFESKRLETITKVRKIYYGTLLAREAVFMLRSSLQNAEDNLKNVQLLRSQGIISEYDELRASVGVDNVRPIVMQSENNYNLAINALRDVIGLSGTTEILPVDSLIFHPIDDSLVAHAEEMVLEANPNLKAVGHQVELNHAVVKAEWSGYLPTLSAFGSYSYTSAKNSFDFSTSDFYKSSQIGLTLSINLFQGLQTSSRIEQAQLEERKTEEQKISLERNLKTGIQSVIGNLKQARKRVESLQRTVETAERGYKIVTTRFLSNAATQLEVNDAQLALTQAQVNRMQAIYDYLVASSDLDQLIGHVPDYAVETMK